ncbi:MAG: hypothetical protein ACYS6W_04025, partial [Planctomycetota bacterium]
MTAHPKRIKFRLFLVVLITILVIGPKTSIVFGQCDFDWKPGQGVPGVNGYVHAVTTWDPDGNGPQPELLIVGGEFTIAGDTLANKIAAWDGSSWQALGSGM